ncbi:MAG: YdiU family protein [Crocinitomicaceae bacterium]|nr:YdiU family protein [Crocinitomicaceae bacterium]
MPKTDKKLNWNFESSYLELPSIFYTKQNPVPVAKPATVFFNEKLAQDLGLDFLNQEKEKLHDYFSGNEIPDGATPLAQAYAGHQFGGFTMLGDGRAILLGEGIDPEGNRFDIQLKGSGRTPYSRRGDGRATLYSMLREYLISEAMFHLKIPTTRSLAVVATGEKVYREEVNEGAVLTRIAKSHLRVGTFEYARAYGSIEDLHTLINYALERHFPEKNNMENPAIALFTAVMHEQIDLIINWLRVGFIHGVMNTDNMHIAGETIDYGPCAFMNAYDPKTVFSSIDRNGRYAFGNQQHVGHWNLTAFANALLPAVAEDQEEAIKLAQKSVDGYQFKFTERYYAMMFAKLGILNPKEEDRVLVNDLLAMMQTHKSDYTQTFLALEEERELEGTLYSSEEFKAWKEKWENLREDKEASVALMRKNNPRVIPRNHWVENALDEAKTGNLEPFSELLEVLANPYGNHSDELKYQPIPEEFDSCYQTFCGT